LGISPKSKRGGGECLLPIERAMPPPAFKNLAAIQATNWLGNTLVVSPPYFAISPPHKKSGLLRFGRRMPTRREPETGFPAVTQSGSSTCLGPLLAFSRAQTPQKWPFMQPTQFEFVLNLETANSLGVTAARELKVID